MTLFDLSDYRRPIWTVSDLNAYIRQLFEIDYRLQDVELQGEISNFTRAASGHLYFTLKDDAAQIRCVMWRSAAERLRFRPANGDAVLATGRVSVYEASGQYQFYAETMQPAGRGDLALAFERLKEKLAAEGLFDAETKQPLPPFPRKIGIVTSADAAALRDILNVLRRRNPLLEVLVAPTLVQGDQAPPQIIRALQWLDGRDDIDTIIVARGGGSIEDLWAFNEEGVARAIFAARHPVIVGVGHETDFTIADFVADVRAPTPSAAAELVAPDLSDYPAYIAHAADRLADALDQRLNEARRRLKSQVQFLGLLSPRSRLDNARQTNDVLVARMAAAIERRIERLRARLDLTAAELAAVSPLGALNRGFAIVRDANGDLVRRVADVAPGARLTVQVSDGRFGATVSE
jgi:exodeoxyribonuclease VII large subunit